MRHLKSAYIEAFPSIVSKFINAKEQTAIDTISIKVNQQENMVVLA